MARAQLGGFYGAFLAQLQGQGEQLEFLGLGLSYRAKSVGVFFSQNFHMFSYFNFVPFIDQVELTTLWQYVRLCCDLF